MGEQKATQPELTPEAANPPQEPEGEEKPKEEQKSDSGKWNVPPEEIKPPEDKPIETTEDRREKWLRGEY